MMFLIRSGRKPSGQSPKLDRVFRGASAAAPRLVLCLAALAAFALFVISAQADEVEPEPEPEAAPQVELKPEPKPAPEPDAEPEPEAVRNVLSADEGPSEPSWIPSIETGFESFDYNTDTTIQNLINAPSWSGTQKEAARQLMYRIGGELMGPEFEDLPGRPRLFAKGGVQIRTFSADEIYAVGDPEYPSEPEDALNSYTLRGNEPPEDLPSAFDGQGAQVLGRFKDPSWYAAVGVAFSVPLATNLLLYVKPSVQYSLEKIDLDGALTTVDEPNPGAVDPDPCGQAPRQPCLREFFIYRSRDNVTTTDHSVGAGIELALVPFRKVRPIRVSLYTEARFMWLVSGSTTEFGDSVASYSVSRDNFGIKGGGGVRFSWVGFD